MKKPPGFIEQTIVFWRRCGGKEFSREDARQMIANVAGFFKVLEEWDRRDREEDKGTEPLC